jgi:hypothetical protein
MVFNFVHHTKHKAQGKPYCNELTSPPHCVLQNTLLSRVGMAGGILRLLLRFCLIAESRIKTLFNGNERDHEIDHRQKSVKNCSGECV